MNRRRPMRRPRGYGAVYRIGRIWWYKPPGGKRQSSHSVLKSDAEDMLKKLMDEQRLGPRVETDASTEAYEDMELRLLGAMRADARRSTDSVEKYRLPHLRRFFGGKLAREIDYDLAAAYVARRLEAKAARATVLYELKLLRHMFSLAKKARKVHSIPEFETVKVGDNARKGFCTPEQIERVIAHLPDHAKAVVRCLYLTGWRSGEVLNLEWRRVDFEAGEMRLDAADTKSGKPRMFPFRTFPELGGLLREQWARTQLLQRKRGELIPAVFTRNNGRPVGSIRTAWRRAVRKAGLPDLIPHDLRRSFARNALRAGVPESDIMKFCGWTTREMFLRYNIVDEANLEASAARLSTSRQALNQLDPTASSRAVPKRKKAAR